MRKILLSAALAGVSTLLTATVANAAIVPTQSSYYTYANDVAAMPNASVICDFDSACQPGYSLVFSGAGTGVYTGSTPNVAAAPPGDNTAYAAVMNGGTATFSSTNNLNYLSFFMGSPDGFNTIKFYDAAMNLLGSFTGDQFLGATVNGDQSLGERITFDMNGAAVRTVVFGSSGNSFEFDRLAVTSVVPEPATWATLIVGFGMMGLAMRRRRRLASVAA